MLPFLLKWLNKVSVMEKELSKLILRVLSEFSELVAVADDVYSFVLMGLVFQEVNGKNFVIHFLYLLKLFRGSLFILLN